jgi:hypothetical protein
LEQTGSAVLWLPATSRTCAARPWGWPSGGHFSGQDCSWSLVRRAGRRPGAISSETHWGLAAELPVRLIWNDLSSRVAPPLGFFFMCFSPSNSGSRRSQESSSAKRRLITLIFEGRRSRLMLMIRRELPRTRLVGRNHITESRALLSVAARLLTAPARSSVPHAAARSSHWRSAAQPIAQMKPTSSRASAVITLPAGFVLPVR